MLLALPVLGLPSFATDADSWSNHAGDDAGAGVLSAGRPNAGTSEPRTADFRYIYDNHSRPLLEETANRAQTQNIYGSGGSIIAQLVIEPEGSLEARCLLADHLGSTRVALDGSDNPIAGFDYTPFGITVASENAAAITYRYTGQRADAGLAGYHFPDREYDPATGRFLSVDPYRSDASPYFYARGDPVNLVDPTGGVSMPFFLVHSGSSGYFDRVVVDPLVQLLGGVRIRGQVKGKVYSSSFDAPAGERSSAMRNSTQMLTGRNESNPTIRSGDFIVVVAPDNAAPSYPRQVTRTMESLRAAQAGLHEDYQEQVHAAELDARRIIIDFGSGVSAARFKAELNPDAANTAVLSVAYDETRLGMVTYNGTQMSFADFADIVKQHLHGARLPPQASEPPPLHHWPPANDRTGVWRGVPCPIGEGGNSVAGASGFGQPPPARPYGAGRQLSVVGQRYIDETLTEFTSQFRE